MMTKEDMVMHKLVGQHDYRQKGLDMVCSVCEKVIEKNSVPHVFSSGNRLSAFEINDNFSALVGAIRELENRLKENDQP